MPNGRNIHVSGKCSEGDDPLNDVDHDLTGRSFEPDMDDGASTFIPNLDECALLLDIDGTILDLAPTPREVWVPPTLRRTLVRLFDRCGGAVAFVSGRPLSDIDLIFAPLQLPAIGGHGAEFRPQMGGETIAALAQPLDRALKRKLAMIAEAGPGILLEDKGYSLALHYRLAPDKEHLVRDAVAAILAEFPQDSVEVLPGKFVVEIKQGGINKATAVLELMKHKPFAGRHPIFIGDDTTDEVVFDIIPDLDGLAFSVGRRVKGVADCFDDPASVRNWLARIAQAEG
jgi:trehalose 6-phosphate phosphatase